MLADFIRKNDEALIKSTSALLTLYQKKLLPATEISQIIEILGNVSPQSKKKLFFINDNIIFYLNLQI